jgi:anhydro-N-acetylmuramic acid kinase
MAAQGAPCSDLVDETLSHPFFAQPPPKTTGREIFGDAFGADLIRRAARRELSEVDAIATATAITAESIARAYKDFGPVRIDDVVLSGGGARNKTLLAMLQALLPASRLMLHDSFGIAAEAKEAVAFALLGFEMLHGRPCNVPTCTGAKSPVILGKLIPGQNYVDLMRRSIQARATQRTSRLRLV